MTKKQIKTIQKMRGLIKQRCCIAVYEQAMLWLRENPCDHLKADGRSAYDGQFCTICGGHACSMQLNMKGKKNV